MKGAVIALFILVPMVLTYLVGIRQGKALGRKDRKDLKDLRDLRWWMVRHAGEHEALGDNFAVLVNKRLGEHFERGSKS